MKSAVLMSKVGGVLVKATYSRKNTPELSYKSVCSHCQNEFLHSRVTAKYCSDKCRKRDYLRKKLMYEQIRMKREFERRRLIEEQERKDKEKAKGLKKIVKAAKDIESTFKIISMQNRFGKK